jgi:hypothetical protein
MLPPKPLSPTPDMPLSFQRDAGSPPPLAAALRLLAPSAADPPADGISVGAAVHSPRWLRAQAMSRCAAAEALADALVDAQGPEAIVLREDCRARALEAAGLAGLAADPAWEVAVLLRISEVLDRCGVHREAIAMQVRALTLMSVDDDSWLAAWPNDAMEPTRPQALS